ncbi:MAG: hypothetical protein JNL97_17390 [Verrucomicrobiales bacterium]|nr:hypothetical protein [Verrucomicrobiales bacterium]
MKTHRNSIAFGLLAGCVVGLAGCGDRDGNRGVAAGSPTSEVPRGTNAPNTSTGQVVAATPAVSGAMVHAPKLVGRWLRPDGGYVLNIRSVDGATGRLDLEYLNPRPIHVAQAEAKEAGGKVAVFVELQDEGYPGSIYRLTYVPQADQMVGTYYQPAADQTFDVEFVRIR